MCLEVPLLVDPADLVVVRVGGLSQMLPVGTIVQNGRKPSLTVKKDSFSLHHEDVRRTLRTQMAVIDLLLEYHTCQPFGVVCAVFDTSIKNRTPSAANHYTTVCG